MPAAAREQAIETAANDELDEMERECAYTPAQLAAAANDAVELQLLNEPSVSGDVKVRVLRYIGGTNPLRQGDELTLNISRAYNRSAALEKARTLGNKLVVLYPGESYGFILPYDQCGLLPDDSFETVSRNFEVHP